MNKIQAKFINNHIHVEIDSVIKGRFVSSEYVYYKKPDMWFRIHDKGKTMLINESLIERLNKIRDDELLKLKIERLYGSVQDSGGEQQDS